MRFGKVWWAHLKDHQFHGRLSLVGCANDGVDRLYCCLSSMGVNRLPVLCFYRKCALHNIDDGRRGMGVPRAPQKRDGIDAFVISAQTGDAARLEKSFELMDLSGTWRWAFRALIRPGQVDERRYIPRTDRSQASMNTGASPGSDDELIREHEKTT